MSRKEKREKKQGNRTIVKLIVTFLFVLAVCIVLKYAQNFIRNDIVDRTNFIVNNNNITADLEKPVLIENETVYVAKEDISNFFDQYVYFDEKYNTIVTGSEKRIAALVVGENTMTDNGSTVKISAPVIEKEGTYYLPISELEDIYNIKVEYIANTDRVIVESIDRKCVMADSNCDNQVKYMPTGISRTVDEIARGESVVLVNDSEENGWIEVRTKRGILGYVKQNSLTNEIVIRDAMESVPKVEGKISMVWDYYSEYVDAPERTGHIKGVNVVSPTMFVLVERRKR